MAPSDPRSRPLGILRAVVVALALTLVAGVAVVAAPGAAAPAGAQVATAANADEDAFRRLTNEARGAAGLAALAEDPAAAVVARSWAAAMAGRQRVEHNPSLVAEVDARVGTAWTRLGENVGRGPGAGPIHTAFMNSSGHRANVLGGYNRVGVGTARDGSGQLWVALVFLQGTTPPAPAPAAAPADVRPFGSATALVERQYLDFLGRPGDAAGVEYWAGQLREGRLTAASEIEWFLRSPEFQGRGAPVVRLYLAGLGRVPDAAGLRYWLDAHRRGQPLASIAATFADTSEFRARYAGQSHAGFVDRLYRTVFGRPADAGGLAHWTAELAAGRANRASVLRAVAGSPEHVRRSASEVTVAMVYTAMLARTPDPAGFAHWVGVVDSGQPATSLIRGVLASPEYAARVA